LTHHLSEKIAARLPSTTTLFQAAQIITNVEHFLVACAELEEQLTKLRCVLTYYVAPRFASKTLAMIIITIAVGGHLGVLDEEATFVSNLPKVSRRP
jgi:Exocyst complex subunit Sec15 C-terminal